VKAKRVICSGTGGVGKTTFSTMLSVLSAQQGKKTLVITIDPSRRLAQTLGLDKDSSKISNVDHPGLGGNLDAMILNSKQVFDSFVRSNSPSEEVAQRIIGNPLYQELSTTLAGSQEFTALEALYLAETEGSYDLIVLDTPPAKHALDFLDAPQKIHSLFQGNIVSKFTQKRTSFIGKLVASGTTKVIEALSFLTGAEFVSQLSDFFEATEAIQDNISKRMVLLQKILNSQDTEFYLVTGYGNAKLHEAREFLGHIRSAGYNLTTVVANRAYPTWLSQPTPDFDSDQLNKEYTLRHRYYSDLLEQYDEFVKGESGVRGISLPYTTESISTIEDIVEFVEDSKECRSILS
jgi:anion-transporting  ArsA/GET3 family ATPase